MVIRQIFQRRYVQRQPVAQQVRPLHATLAVRLTQLTQDLLIGQLISVFVCVEGLVHCDRYRFLFFLSQIGVLGGIHLIPEPVNRILLRRLLLVCRLANFALLRVDIIELVGLRLLITDF